MKPEEFLNGACQDSTCDPAASRKWALVAVLLALGLSAAVLLFVLQ